MKQKVFVQCYTPQQNDFLKNRFAKEGMVLAPDLMSASILVTDPATDQSKERTYIALVFMEAPEKSLLFNKQAPLRDLFDAIRNLCAEEAIVTTTALAPKG